MTELLPRPALSPSPRRVLHIRRGDGPSRRTFHTAARFDVAAKGLGKPLELLEVVSGVSSDGLLVLGAERGALLAEALGERVHRFLMRLVARVELGVEVVLVFSLALAQRVYGVLVSLLSSLVVVWLCVGFGVDLSCEYHREACYAFVHRF